MMRCKETCAMCPDYFSSHQYTTEVSHSPRCSYNGLLHGVAAVDAVALVIGHIEAKEKGQ